MQYHKIFALPILKTTANTAINCQPYRFERVQWQAFVAYRRWRCTSCGPGKRNFAVLISILRPNPSTE